MSLWKKDWFRGLVHTGAAVLTMGASVPVSAAYEVYRYGKRKGDQSGYKSGYGTGYGEGYSAGALTAAEKAEKDDDEDKTASAGVVYDGALANAEQERRKKKSQTLTGQGDDTFASGALG